MRSALLLLLIVLPAAFGQSLGGLWDATVTINDTFTVPFQIEVASEGSSAHASFFNGKDRFPSTAGRFEGGKLHLEFNYYTATLDAVLKDGELTGSYDRGERGAQRSYKFSARPHVETAAKSGAPNIDGAWELAVKSSKGEKAWHFLVQQKGSHVDAAILRVDGDTGTLSGAWQGESFVISHFSGARAALMRVTPQADGSLKIVQEGLTAKNEYTALRPAVARAKGLEPPTDPIAHTTVRDLTEPFHFKFADVNGKIVSSDDPRFKGKVVIVNMLGSWCPNCHDEAPFLAALYKQYRAKGVEVVALSFEEGDQAETKAQLKNFIARYGIEYTVLVPGHPAKAKEKLPQLVNFDAWPTTFFLDKTGRVAKVHAGFPSSASGEAYEQAKAEFKATVEDLLSAKESQGCVVEPMTIVAVPKKAPDCTK